MRLWEGLNEVGEHDGKGEEGGEVEMCVGLCGTRGLLGE